MLLISATACTSSKVFTTQFCKVCLSQEDGVLLLPLAWETSFRLLSVAEQNQLERQILEKLRSRGFTKVELYDRLDYELLKAGIKDLNDPKQLSKISSELGYPYLLGLSMGPSRAGESWAFLSPEEVNASVPTPSPDMEVSATVRIALIETDTGQIVSDKTVVSSNSGWSNTDEDGGEDYWNFASISGVLFHGVDKGTAAMVKDCGC
ncbi:hypothetical protein [Algoriphagus jejuensis]